MFKHLLVPTDGSKLSESAVRRAIDFARDAHAKVTGFHVKPKFHVLSYQLEMVEDNMDQFEREAQARAEQYLSVIEAQARIAGVEYDSATASSDHPYEAIIRAARDHDCDLITMASHGRKGLQATLIGSETQKVLTHCDIPVLVYR